MSEEEYVVEFEDKPGRWVPITGATYRSKEGAEEASKEEAEKLGVRTRVVPSTPIWDEWNFMKLSSRLEGTGRAAREMKKRGEAGAVAAWAIYKDYMKNLIRLACGAGPSGELAREPAFRVTLIRDMDVVGEAELIEQIEGLWRKYPEGIPTSEVMDLQDDWDEGVERRVGRRIPRRPEDLTREEIEESRRISRELHELKPKPPVEEVAELEKMKKELERRIAALREKE